VHRRVAWQKRRSHRLAALLVPPSDGKTVTVYPLPEPVEMTRLGSMPRPKPAVPPVPAAEHPLAASTRIAALMIVCFTLPSGCSFEPA
jgi:hypothetical protein